MPDPAPDRRIRHDGQRTAADRTRTGGAGGFQGNGQQHRTTVPVAGRPGAPVAADSPAEHADRDAHREDRAHRRA